MTIIFSTSYFSNPSFRAAVAASSPEKKMEKVIKGFESKLPIAEKQTELLVKLLNSEKHRGKLIEDINNIKSRSGRPLWLRDSYLYRVFEKLKIPLEAARVKMRGDEYDPRPSYRHLLFPRSLVILAYGEGIINRRERCPCITTKQSERISIIVNQLIELQQAYISAATDNLPETNFQKIHDNDKVKKPKKNDYAFAYYGTFFHTEGERRQSLSDNTSLWGRSILEIMARNNKLGYFVGVSIEYINSLQKMNEFFSDNGFPAGSFGNEWDQMNDIWEKTIEMKASEKDLDDLSDLTSESDAPATPGEDDGLSLDDLSLPE